MSDEILKSKITNFYIEFESFIKLLDTNKDKNILDKEIQDKFDSFNNPVIELINSSFPSNVDYNNNRCRAYYYQIVNKEFEKFFILWQECLDKV